MTADEIRRLNETLCRDPRDFSFWLQEIAAQLAEHNATLRLSLEESRVAREDQKANQAALFSQQTSLQEYMRKAFPPATPVSLPDVGTILDTPMGKLIVIEEVINGEKTRAVRPISDEEAEVLSQPATKQ